MKRDITVSLDRVNTVEKSIAPPCALAVTLPVLSAGAPMGGVCLYVTVSAFHGRLTPAELIELASELARRINKPHV